MQQIGGYGGKFFLHYFLSADLDISTQSWRQYVPPKYWLMPPVLHSVLAPNNSA